MSGWTSIARVRPLAERLTVVTTRNRCVWEGYRVADVAFLAAVATGVVEAASAQTTSGALEWLRKRLRRDPVRRAVADAIGDALAQVGRDHREAVAALFDRAFLDSKSVSRVLARALVPGEEPRVEDLVGAWERQFSGDYESYGEAKIRAAAADFLDGFQRGLDAPERQGALRELRTYRLQREMVDATGLLAGWADSQRRRLIDPVQRYEELDLDRFSGRAWLVEKLDGFLAGHDDGYFVLQGPAGVGKSAFLAWLARGRGYAVHFVRLVRGRDDTAEALTNLAVQLADRWPVEAPVALRGRDVEPHEFYALLSAIAQARRRLRRSDPVVIVIDGLDEVRATPGDRGNVLGLPERPPEGVYFVVSMRPVHVELRGTTRHLCPLASDDQRHLDDLRAYLETACTRPGIAAALHGAEVADDELICALSEKSRGVWLYVHYVLSEIERGQRNLTELDDLPTGLWSFYAEQCTRAEAQDSEQWKRCDRRILATLAVVLEPVESATLGALAGVEDEDAVDEVAGRWAAFLERDGDPPYWLYHDSFRRFLNGEASTELTAAERKIAGRFERLAHRAHERIADHYLDRWGCLGSGLPGLRDPDGIAADGGYGVRHIAVHLGAAGRYENLRSLLWSEWREGKRPVSAWYEAHAQAGNHMGYLSDIAYASQLAEARTDQAVESEQPAITIADEYGYALLTASILSHSKNIPAELRSLLVRRGMWTSARAIAEARSIADPEARVSAFHSLAGQLGAQERRKVLGEALDAARQIREEVRAQALGLLAEHLDPAQLGEALDAARKISHEHARARLLGSLAEHLDPAQRGGVLGEALDAARQAPEYARADALGSLAEHLEPAQLGEALDAARQISDKSARARLLGSLAEHLDPAQRSGVLGEALDAARQAPESDGARLLGSLAEYLDPAQRSGVLGEALDAARQIRDEYLRACVMASVTENCLRQPQTISPCRSTALALLAWREGLRASARLGRPSLLKTSTWPLTVVSKLGGTEALAQVVAYIHLASRWWT